MAVFSNWKTFAVALCALLTACRIEAQSPVLSASLLAPGILQFSWPSNFASGNWQLVSSTNLGSGTWTPVPARPLPATNAIVLLTPDFSGYFRLQQTGSGGGCIFQATPPAINPGDSTTLSWCPAAGYTYWILPTPGTVTGNTLSVSPTTTTVYSLIASNALGLLITNNAAVIVGPCGWLQVNNLDAFFNIAYFFSRSTPNYNFDIAHIASSNFHLHRLSSTATDAYFFGFTTDDQVFGPVPDSAYIKDREDDKTGPQVFTTTELGGQPFVTTPSLHNVSTLTLHLTCTTYDFSYNVLMDTTEYSQFGTFASSDGVATGTIVTRPLPGVTNRVMEDVDVPGEYPPNAGDYYTPSSDLGKAMFTTGTVGATAGEAHILYGFFPVP